MPAIQLIIAAPPPPDYSPMKAAVGQKTDGTVIPFGKTCLAIAFLLFGIAITYMAVGNWHNLITRFVRWILRFDDQSDRELIFLRGDLSGSKNDRNRGRHRYSEKSPALR